MASTKISKKVQKQLLEIAKEHMVSVEMRGDLEERKSDSEDFIDVSVWSIESALQAAYELGRAQAK